MAGGKRKAAETDAPSKANARSTKSAKVDKASKSSSKSASKAKPTTKRPTLTAEAFKQTASSLHLSLTHKSPPASVPETNGGEGSAVANNNTSTDSEPIASLSAPPTVFSTGSYGWKGQQRVNIELHNPETGEKETVNVTININATVLGSKPSAKDKDKANKKAEKEVVKNDESEDVEEEDEDE